MTVIWLKYDDGELTKVDIEIRTDTDFYDVKKALKLEAPNRFGGLDAAAITVKNPRTQLPINSDELLEPFLRADGENVLRFLVNAPLAAAAPGGATTTGAGYQVSAQALDQDLIERISSSVLSIRYSDGDVIATAVVWDYTTSHVLLLTNYHTWDEPEFKYCFPPPNPEKPIPKSKNANPKRKKSEDPVHLTLSNSDFEHEFVVTSEVFQFCEKEEDFAVLKLPRGGFTMPRIPVGLGVCVTLKVHAFGYIGYTRKLNISSGEVSGFIPEGFTMNLLSAGGFSGAAIIADGYGRAIGYMGGNLDASTKNNSQHQSYGFRFDRVITVTNRQLTPTKSPLGEGNSCGGKATK